MSARTSNSKTEKPITKTQKQLVFAALILVAMTTAAVGASFMIAVAPNPEKQSREERARYMASDRFAKLNDKDKLAYFEKSQQLDGGMRFRGRFLPEDQRDNLRQNLRPLIEKQMQKRMEAFFAMTPEDQTKELDRILDQRQNGGRGGPGQFGMGGRGFGPGGPGGPGRRGQPSVERLQRRIENTDPKIVAMRQAYRDALQKRAQQRGMN